jgi:glycerol-3-phosphate dehydrogenase
MYDVLIVGAGITGAAAAYEFSKYKLSLAVLEKENDAAMGATRANSAIIHAGYDPAPGTLMASLNVEGAELAKELCVKLDVPHSICGSLVLAFDDEGLAHIRTLYDRGIKNGAKALELLNREQALALEANINPAVKGALLAGEAMIINPWEYALALVETAVRNGADLFFNAEVLSIKRTGDHFTVESKAGMFESRRIINAAGIYADTVHNMAAPPYFSIIPKRGEYYLLDRAGSLTPEAFSRCPVWRIIFQCPTKEGKGTLVAPTVHGNTIAGPNNAPADRDDFSCTAEGLADVAARALKSIPSLDTSGFNLKNNIRNFAGLRAAARRTDTGEDINDFIIEEAAPGFFDAAGIKSPGLSAAPAIARLLFKLMSEKGLGADKKENFIDSRKRIKFALLSAEEKNALIKQDPSYGRIICRCETVSEGEILASLREPVPPHTVDGVKRRCGPGLGRCQGGFCGPKVVKILSDFYKIDPRTIEQDRNGSYILIDDV